MIALSGACGSEAHAGGNLPEFTDGRYRRRNLPFNSTPANGEVAMAVGNRVTLVPPPRTGRAGLSGSAAIAGFCPHRTHRAALPQWALQEGPEAD